MASQLGAFPSSPLSLGLSLGKGGSLGVGKAQIEGEKDSSELTSEIRPSRMGFVT